jgi:hypothetical protein
MRGNKNKEKIEQADFPAEAPESSSDKCETGNAEHSMHDLSSEPPKACSHTEISESRGRAKNDGGANQAEKHSALGIRRKKYHSLVVPDARPWQPRGKETHLQAPISFLP